MNCVLCFIIGLLQQFPTNLGYECTAKTQGADVDSGGGDLWTQILEDNRESRNIVFSPVLVTQGLGILMSGSAGDTETKLRAALVGDADVETLYGALRSALSEKGRNIGRKAIKTYGVEMEEIDGQLVVVSVLDAQQNEVFQFREGDVITSVCNERVDSIEQLAEAISREAELTFGIERGAFADGKSPNDLIAAATLTAHTSIWLHEDATVGDEFRDKVASEFSATAHTLNFKTFSADYKSWVARMGISDSNPIPEVSEETAVLVQSYASFQGLWKVPFEEATQAAFQTDDGRTLTTKMMQVRPRGGFKTWEIEGSVAVEVPYQGSRYSAVLMLPKQGVNTRTQLGKIALALMGQFRKAEKENLHLVVPVFSFKSHVSLRPSLSSLGLDGLFDKTANFSRISSDPLKVDEFVQTAEIRFDKLGTVAGVSQSINVITLAPSREILFNRAFLFAVFDLATNQLVFSGYVSDPAE